MVGGDRFLAEIETTANLQHPHILPLFDSGAADGFLFFVMPFVEGETLRHRIDRRLVIAASAGLALLARAAGHRVAGSDAAIYPPMSTQLAAEGIELTEGYSDAQLDPRPDLVVVGNTIRKTNPEALALAELGIPYVSFPQALGHYFLSGKTSLVVSGTHGKTTTSSLLATLLHKSDQSPGFMIGGLVQAFGR